MRARRLIAWAGLVIAFGVLTCTAAGDAAAEAHWLQQNRAAQREYEQRLNAVPTTGSLRALHDVLCAEPHPAGSDGDARMIETLRELFVEYGLHVQVHEIHPLLARPIDAKVSITVLGPTRPDGIRTVRDIEDYLELPVREPEFAQDPYSSHEDLTIGWNAFSGSGDASGTVVYANYGTKADFKTLKRLGVDVRGRIVLARYGGNYRGYKAKFAEEAGAAGLLIFTDPANSGYSRGPMYPEGGWAHGGYIQNGSIKTLPYPGDPLTPGIEATESADRLSVDDVALPRIPVQPIGWDAAQQIMERMTGEPLPREIRNDWQGGLPLAYRLTGGDALRVRVQVEQRRETMPTANVLGIVKGEAFPDQVVVVGCHFDAWTFGAGDPHAGSIVLMEMARSFGEAAKQGKRPARTVIFANWGAEEFGIIGSTEWVEANRQRLLNHGVAYINLDMATMGPNFGCSSAPLLKTVIAEAARAVPQPYGDDERRVYDQWVGVESDEPSYGTLGGGSDHVGFYCHAGIASCGLGARGSDGVSYHSNSDNLTWYRKVVGDDYEPALMLTRLGNLLTARLANADLLPLDPAQYADDTRAHLDAIEAEAATRGQSMTSDDLRDAIMRFEQQTAATMQSLRRAVASSSISADRLGAINRELLTIERCWLRDEGLVNRPWYRSLFAATDPDSGYGAWMLPGLREAMASGDASWIDAALDEYCGVFEALTERLSVIGGHVSSTNAD